MNLIPTLFRRKTPAVNPFAVATVAVNAPIKAAAPVARTLPDGVPVEMQRIIRPQAAMNWLSPMLAQMTPQRIESILRGSMGGDFTQQWQLFDLMEDTWPRLGKNLNEVKRSACRMNWAPKAYAEDDKAPSDLANEKCKLVSAAIRKMRPDVSKGEASQRDMIYDLLDAWGKGISVLEILWESNFGGEGILPRAVSWVHPGNYGFANDGSLGLLVNRDGSVGQPVGGAPTWSSIYGSAGRGNQVIPFIEHKFLVAIAKAKTGHASTTALLRPLAWWWCAANFSSDWLLNFAQIFGLPIRWAEYDPTQPGLFEKVCDMLANMGSTTWAAVPQGATLNIIEASKGSAGNATPQGDLIDRADKQCDLLILGETLTTDVSAKGSGSKALGEVHADVRDDIVQAAAEFVAEILNTQFVPAVLALNYGEGGDVEAPVFCPEPKKNEDKKGEADRIKVLADAGLKIPVSFVYKTQGIPKPQANEETIGGAVALPAPAPGADPNSDSTTEGTENGKDKTNLKGRQVCCGADATALRARDAQADQLLESVTGVEARWLGGLKPYYRELIAMAEGSESDAKFGRKLAAVLAKSQERYPELFAKMDVAFLADRFEGVMGAACVNGAVSGWMKRRSVGRGRPTGQAGTHVLPGGGE